MIANAAAATTAAAVADVVVAVALSLAIVIAMICANFFFRVYTFLISPSNVNFCTYTQRDLFIFFHTHFVRLIHSRKKK